MRKKFWNLIKLKSTYWHVQITLKCFIVQIPNISFTIIMDKKTSKSLNVDIAIINWLSVSLDFIIIAAPVSCWNHRFGEKSHCWWVLHCFGHLSVLVVINDTICRHQCPIVEVLSLLSRKLSGFKNVITSVNTKLTCYQCRWTSHTVSADIDLIVAGRHGRNVIIIDHCITIAVRDIESGRLQNPHYE